MFSSSPRTARGGPSVLAVDDDPDTARLLSEYLQDFGMDVEIARTGAQMESFLDRRTFDIVLLDLMLPDIAGMELCSWSKDRDPDLPVIMLTADDDAETCIEGLARGADDYLGKPFAPRELVARIKAVMMHAPGVDLSDRSVDACVSNLRGKLRGQRSVIRTVRGEGYLLQPAWR